MGVLRKKRTLHTLERPGEGVKMNSNTKTPPQPSHVTLERLPLMHKTKLHARVPGPSQTDLYTFCSEQLISKKDH